MPVIVLLLLSAPLAFSQAVRWDLPGVYTTNQSNPLPGGMYQVLALPGATVQICSGTPCVLATTYTDATAGTPCPTTAQLTRGTATACYSTSDSNGSAGAWLLGGNYQYTITTAYGSFGPFAFGVNAGTNYVPLTGGAMTGPLTGPRINGALSVTGYGAKCDGATDDTASFQSAATAANAIYVATGTPVTVTQPGACVIAGTVLLGSGVHFNGQGGTIIVPNQATGGAHATLVAQNADNVSVENVTVNVITPCAGNNAACFAIGWQDTNADSSAHAHVYFRHNTIINSNWGILVGYYVGGSGSLSDVSITDNDVSSPSGSYTNADGIHVAGRVSGATIAGNRISNRNDAGIGLTSEGSGTYVQSGATVTGNVLTQDRVGIDCSGCTDTSITGNFVKATISAAGTSDPAFREIYYNGYPGNVHVEGNYFENPTSSESAVVKIDPILAGQVSWPAQNSTFIGNTIGGTSGILYARGNTISIANNTFVISGGGVVLDYDGSDNVATANVTIGTNHWMGAGVVTFGGGCALYSNIGYFPQQSLGALTVSNLSCIGTQTFTTPGDFVIGSTALKAPTGLFINSIPGAGASFDFVWRDPANTTNHMILDNGGNLNLPVGWIATAQYFKMGGGGAGGLRNSAGATVVPGTATDYQGTSATIVGMCEAKSMTVGNLLKVGASGGCADSGIATSGSSVGSAVQLSTTGANGTFWGVTGGIQQWLTPSGVLPAASSHQQLFTVDTGSTAHLLTEANSQINAVFNEGIDNSGVSDMSTALGTLSTSLCALTNPPPLYLPAGTYKINSGWLIGATSTTCGYMTIIGAGAGTILQTDCSGNSYGLWYNNTTNSGDSFKGIRIEHLQIQDTSGTGACQDLLKLTQVARVIVNDVTVSGAKGQVYSTGTVASTGATVTGTGTTWTAAMAHGYLMTTSGTTTTRAEICAVGGATSITLCSNAFPTGNIAGGTSYAIAFAGRGITCDPGNSFSQYISIHDSYAPGNLIGFDAMGSNSGSNGCSRVTIDGSAHYIAQTPGARVTNSVGMWFGRQADTIKVNTAINNVAACYVMDSAHSWQINGECEDNSTYAPVTTCNGGVGTQNCTVAAEVSSDANGSGWSGSFLNMYAYLVGTVYQYDNATGAFNTQILGDRTLSGQYTTHYSFSGATGCPASASGIKAIITTYDCNHQLVAQTVN